MTPAKSIEEAALAKARSAALKSLRIQDKLPDAVEIKENPAGRAEGMDSSRELRRAAFRHLMRKRF